MDKESIRQLSYEGTIRYKIIYGKNLTLNECKSICRWCCDKPNWDGLPFEELFKTIKDKSSRLVRSYIAEQLYINNCLD